MQENEQQSGPTEHASSFIKHWPGTREHKPVSVSQLPVQQSAAPFAPSQAVPVEVHDGSVG